MRDLTQAQRRELVERLMSTAEERAELLAEIGEVPGQTDVEQDPYTYMSKLIFSRWKPFVLRAIYIDGSTSFSRFVKQLPISQKVLSQNLKALQQDGLIVRNVFPENPPRAEYCLTHAGETLIELLDLIYDWGWNDMRRKGLPVDPQGEVWHGYRAAEDGAEEQE